MVEVVLAERGVSHHVLHEWDVRPPIRVTALAPIAACVGRPINDVGVLPLRTEVVDAEAVVVIPRDEGEVRPFHEAVGVAAEAGVVEVVVRGRGEVVVPAANEQIHASPAQEGPHVHDRFERLAVRVGVEPLLAAGQTDAVDHSHELREVVVGARPPLRRRWS